MNPVPATYVDKIHLWDSETPGEYTFVANESVLLFICPCGCGSFTRLPVAPPPKRDGAWMWDGNVEKPTIQPSIRQLSGCKFHGFLTEGIWTFCEDSGR